MTLPAAHFTIPKADPKRTLPAIPDDVVVRVLDNGLVIIVREDHSAPVVAVQAWSRSGSIDEGKWLGAGLSHLLEHMLFKGTTTRTGARIDQEVQEAGGSMNAYTSFDRTVYYVNGPDTGARVSIDILTDIMQHANLPAEELEKEMEVIRREMAMGQDDPSRLSGKRLFETAYTRSPYRFPIIGYRDIFDQLKSEDVHAYYRDRYAPNNSFYVVVGDVKADEVIDQIATSYAKTPARPQPAVAAVDEPRQTAPRDVIEYGPIQLGHAHFSWHIPDLRDADVPVLDVLSVILGSGKSSRIYREVREKQGLIAAGDAWTYSPGNPGLFGMSMSVEPAKFEAARAAMQAELDKILHLEVSHAELEKARKQFTTGFLSSRRTMQGQAQDLGGNWLAAQDLNFSERYFERAKATTAADIVRVARTHLIDTNRTFFALLPKEAQSQRAPVAREQLQKPVQRFSLPGGLTLLVKEDHRLPFVHYRAAFKGGVLAETKENNGAGQLLARLLLKGTKTRTAEDISTGIEGVGGSVDSYSGSNSVGLNLETLNEDLTYGLNLMHDLLVNPQFPAESLVREREVLLASLKAQEDQLLQAAFRTMRRKMYGETLFGLDPLGTEESLAALNVDAVRALYLQLVRPENGVISVYGDVQAEDVRKRLTGLFMTWQPAGEVWKCESNPTVHPKSRTVENKQKEQAVLVVAFPGVTLFHEDHYALEMIQEACSDLGSRLFIRIRDELGLAYYVGARNVPGVIPGYFAFYVGTAPDQADLVETEILDQCRLIRESGLTLEELNRSKAKLLGQRKISRQDLGDTITTHTLDELYGQGFDNSERDDVRYQAVTLDEVLAVARKYLDPEKAVISIIKP